MVVLIKQGVGGKARGGKVEAWGGGEQRGVVKGRGGGGGVKQGEIPCHELKPE